MALNVKMVKYLNQLINEDIVVARLVNQQTLDFNQLCDYLADGSTLTAGDVAAVMKLIEVRLPRILGLNTKVICSPEGLTFKPTVSGSLTQSQLRKKLEDRKAAETDAEKAAKIDVNRTITVSDLTTSDLTASIAIEMPKMWIDRFKSQAGFKRTTSSDSEAESSDESNSNTGSGGSNPDSGNNNTGGGSTPGDSDDHEM